MNTRHSETEFVSLLKQKDLGAFSKLYKNYSSNLLGVIFQLIKNKQVSEDILQNVFVKIWSNIDQYNPSRGRLHTWMVSIAVNASIDYAKSKNSKKDKQSKSIDSELGIFEIESSPFNVELIGLKEQVYLLKYDYRVLLEYVYYHGFTHEEVADELSLPLGTVKTRIRAAITELKKRLNLLYFGF
jgi:RNA polymerase sigma factor (sigma-70 family)